MTRSLVLVGALVAIFATGALLTRGVGGERTLSVKHPTLFTKLRANHAVPDARSLERLSGVIVPNLGQAKGDVYYQLMLPEVTASLRLNDIEIRSRTGGGRDARSVDLRFFGANTAVRVKATALAKDRLRYTVEQDESQSMISIPLFSEITYMNLYDGVDLVVKASRSAVTRRFALRPGLAADRILFRYEGAEPPLLMPSGDVRVETSGRVVTYARPVAFQEFEGQRMPVRIGYKLGRYGALGFEVGEHDSALPLVIEVEGV